MSYEFDPIDLDGEFVDNIYEEALTDEDSVHFPIRVLGPKLVKTLPK